MCLPFHNKVGLLTPYREILSSLHSDNEGNQEHMVIRRGFGVARP